MRSLAKYIAAIVFIAIIFWGCEAISLTAYAWGDSSSGRPQYTVEEINNGALGPVGENAADQAGYPGTIVFNSIINKENSNLIEYECNFVGAREYAGINLGQKNVWNGNSITVEDGKTYIIRLYVHNNNPNGEDAVAEDVHVSFDVPTDSSRIISVFGLIDSSNATPAKYWDKVDFESDVPFHLEYIYGSALLENNGIGAGGLQLSDDIVMAASGGTLIGYDELDGRIPGCYQYASYVTILVKAVYDYGFSIENKVRIADGGDGDFFDEVDVEVGDIVEFLITYQNNDEVSHSDVMISDHLPSGLAYEAGTTVLYDMEHIDGTQIDDIIADTESGLHIGPYEPGAYARIYFRAKVVGNVLDDGRNVLVNGAQVQVGHITQQSSVKIEAYSVEWLKTIATLAIVLFAAIALSKVLFKQYTGAKRALSPSVGKQTVHKSELCFK